MEGGYSSFAQKLANSPAIEEKLRQGFKKYLNPFMLSMWRLGLGGWINGWPEVGGRILVLTHIGRKSGIRRQTPVNYTRIGDDLYITAGFGQLSDWYRNLRANPQVEVWLPEEPWWKLQHSWWSGIAEDISDDPGRLKILRQVLIASGFAAWAVGINPKTISDDQLAAMTETYRLIRIRRTEACTGCDGPGDAAWVWPVATSILLAVLFLRRKR